MTGKERSSGPQGGMPSDCGPEDVRRRAGQETGLDHNSGKEEKTEVQP